MVNAITPRRACPTLVMPMATGDGYLARLPPLLAPLTPDQLAGMAAAAAAHGNGLVEITRRGNWQVRGLAKDGGPALAAALADLDLPDGPPLSADALLPPEAVSRARRFRNGLEARIEETGLRSRLAPKIALVADFGTPFAPTALTADIRVTFRSDRAHLGIGGNARSATWLGSVAAGEADDAAFRLLEALAALGPFARYCGSAAIPATTAIGRSLTGITGFVPDLAGPPPHASAETERALEPGAEAVAVLAFPFGQANASDMAGLAEAARLAGISAIAAAPERRLLLAGDPEAREAARIAARRLGLILGPADPRRAVFACIGSAGCASGALPTRTLAAELSAALPSLLDGSFALHLSGCTKGCAHADAAAITLSAIDKRLAIVLEGRARDTAHGFVPAKEIAGRLQRLAAEIDDLRLPGESSAAVLARIGAGRIAAILLGETPDRSLESGSEIDGREPTASERDGSLSAGRAGDL